MAELRRTQVPNRPSLRRGWFLAALVVVAVVAGAAGTVIFRAGGDEPGRDGDLAAVQRAVGEARSVRFTFRAETHHDLGDLDPVGVVPARSVGSGEWTPDRWRMLTHGDDGSAIEMVLDGDTAYVRATDDAGVIGTEPWARREDAITSPTEGLTGPGSVDELFDLGPGEEVDDLMAVLLAEAVYLSSDQGVVDTGDLWADDPAVVGDPAGFLDAIARLSGPKRAPMDGGAGLMTLTATLRAPADLAEAFGRPLPDATVELDIGEGHLPTALRFDLAQGTSSSSMDVRFTDWDAPVEIALPSDDDIGLSRPDDDNLERAGDIDLVWPAPTEIPEGWDLTVYWPRDVANLVLDESGCNAVGLSWYGPQPEEATAGQLAGHLSIVLRTADCALTADPTPFEPGGPAGRPRRTQGPGGFTEILVDDTVVQLNTSLTGAALDDIVATLAPVDVEAIVAAAG
jgi:hypothetical protein